MRSILSRQKFKRFNFNYPTCAPANFYRTRHRQNGNVWQGELFYPQSNQPAAALRATIPTPAMRHSFICDFSACNPDACNAVWFSVIYLSVILPPAIRHSFICDFSACNLDACNAPWFSVIFQPAYWHIRRIIIKYVYREALPIPNLSRTHFTVKHKICVYVGS